MTARQKLPYNFKNEQVHLARLFGPGSDSQRFACHRCGRSLPVDSFEPLFNVSDGFKNSNRKHLGLVQALHPHCWTCQKQTAGEWVKHSLYTPSLDRYFAQLVKASRAGCHNRGLVFAVSKDDVLGYYLKQEGKCALTGLQMDWTAKGTVGSGNGSRMTPSIDRIDSHGNYTLNNIQIVCAVANIMKNDLSVDEFVALCERVAGYRMERLFQ